MRACVGGMSRSEDGTMMTLARRVTLILPFSFLGVLREGFSCGFWSEKCFLVWFHIPFLVFACVFDIAGLAEWF